MFLQDHTSINQLGSNYYIYQQTLRPNQQQIPWRLIPIDGPKKTTRNKEVPPNPNDPRLTLQDLEEMNKQLLAEFEGIQFRQQSRQNPYPRPRRLIRPSRRLAYLR